MQRMKKILDDPEVSDVKKNEARRNLVDNDLVNTSHAYHARREMIRQARVFISNLSSCLRAILTVPSSG